MKKCPNCGACQECGAPPMPRPIYPYPWPTVYPYGPGTPLQPPYRVWASSTLNPLNNGAGSPFNA